MTLRNQPPEAEPVRKEIADLESDLTTKFNTLYSNISWLDEDRWDLFYRPAYFGTFDKEDRKLCRMVHEKAALGKTSRSFGITYDLYLITMNNLNFGNALAGPGLRYKDGQLARIYINRIIDSSHDMQRELDKITKEVRNLRISFGMLPDTHDDEWVRRYRHVGNLISQVENSLQECDDSVDKREELGDKLLLMWFPEEQTERSSTHPKAEVVEETQGTINNPYTLKQDLGEELDITDLVDSGSRDAHTYFNFPVPEALRGHTWKFKFRTVPAQDWDTHVDAYAGNNYQFGRDEMRDPTPHSIELMPTAQTTDIRLRLEHWERVPNQTRKAFLTVDAEGWEDDGGL